MKQPPCSKTGMPQRPSDDVGLSTNMADQSECVKQRWLNQGYAIYTIYIWYPYIYESVYTCIYMRNTITWHIYHNMYVLSSNKTERPMKPGLQNKDAQKSFSPNSAGSCMKLDPCPYHPFGWRVVVVGFYQSWVDSHGWAWLQLVNGNIKSIHKSSLFIIFTCFNHIFVTFVYICLVFV